MKLILKRDIHPTFSSSCHWKGTFNHFLVMVRDIQTIALVMLARAHCSFHDTSLIFGLQVLVIMEITNFEGLFFLAIYFALFKGAKFLFLNEYRKKRVFETGKDFNFFSLQNKMKLYIFYYKYT